jgi:hypothetical protein
LTVADARYEGTFDDLVAHHASSPEARDRILNNKLYRHVSTCSLGRRSTWRWKLYALKADDRRPHASTPPTTNALDFLDARTG